MCWLLFNLPAQVPKNSSQPDAAAPEPNAANPEDPAEALKRHLEKENQKNE